MRPRWESWVRRRVWGSLFAPWPVRVADAHVRTLPSSAGILNRCDRLLLVDEKAQPLATHEPKKDHPLFDRLGEARKIYWDIYKENAPVPDGMRLDKYIL